MKPDELPYSIEAEEALLGCCLMDGATVMPLVRHLLSVDSFHREKHRWLWQALKSLDDSRTGIDYLTAGEALGDRLDEAGGFVWLTELAFRVPSVVGAESYARQLTSYTARRTSLAEAEALARLAYTGASQAELVAAAYRMADRIASHSTTREPQEIGAFVKSAYERLERRMAGAEPSGIPTVSADLNRILGGWRNGELVIIQARPGIGKTSFALANVAHATEQGYRALFFSLEMAGTDLVDRLAASWSGVNLQGIRNGELSDYEYNLLMDAYDRLAALPIALDDAPGLSAEGARGTIARYRARYPDLALVAVDYAQRMRPATSEQRQQRYEQLGAISRTLKETAREFDIPILLPAQTGRGAEARTDDKRPRLSDLRECVTGDTLLMDARRGRPIAIRDVRPGALIYGMGGRQRIGVFEVEGVWPTGTKPTWTITTRTGKRLTATANHPLYTATGWKQLQELEAGDVIATAMRLPGQQTISPTPDNLCRLLGYMAGDGTCQKHREVGFISADAEVMGDAVGIVEEHFSEITIRYKSRPDATLDAQFVRIFDNGYGKPGGNPLRNWLDTVGMHGSRDSTKVVPAVVFEAGWAGAVEFLAGYLATDGCVKQDIRKSGKTRWQVHFDSVSRELLSGVQTLLLKIGVVALINDGYMSVKATQPLYRLYVAPDRQNLLRFAMQVHPRGKKGRLLGRLMREEPVGTTGSQVFALPREVSELAGKLAKDRTEWHHQHKRMGRHTAARLADYFEHDGLKVWAESELLWEDIKSIEPAGEQEVFDIKVPKAHNFLANGIVAHNSGDLEADADVVIGLYRDEVYYSRTDKAGIAEVIISKHRNGPTGTVELHFDRATGKWSDLEKKQSEKDIPPWYAKSGNGNGRHWTERVDF